MSLRNQDNINFTKVLFNNLGLKIFEEFQIKNLVGEIFIKNFNSAFGSIEGNGFEQNFEATLIGKDLSANPILSLNTQLEIDMEEIFPGTDFLRIKGKELSKIQLSYNSSEGLELSLIHI